MQLDSSSVPPFIGAQDLMKLAGVYDAFTLLKLLFNDYGYIYLEGTTISDNGAYLIHLLIGQNPILKVPKSAGLQWKEQDCSL